MAQQINLHSPILLKPRRYFSALAMLQSLAVLAAALAALSTWSTSRTRDLQRDLAPAIAADAAEQQRLNAALATRPTVPLQASALEQELAQALKQLAGQEQRLAALQPATALGQVSRSALLHVLAQTVPDAVWLTEVKLLDGRVEIAGATLQPEALRPWLVRLSAHPALAGQTLQAVQVERRAALPAAERESWAFRVVSGRARARSDAAAAGPAP